MLVLRIDLIDKGLRAIIKIKLKRANETIFRLIPSILNVKIPNIIHRHIPKLNKQECIKPQHNKNFKSPKKEINKTIKQWPHKSQNKYSNKINTNETKIITINIRNTTSRIWWFYWIFVWESQNICQKR